MNSYILYKILWAYITNKLISLWSEKQHLGWICENINNVDTASLFQVMKMANIVFVKRWLCLKMYVHWDMQFKKSEPVQNFTTSLSLFKVTSQNYIFAI